MRKWDRRLESEVIKMKVSSRQGTSDIGISVLDQDGAFLPAATERS